MTEQEIRLECLRMIIMAPDFQTDDVVALAKEMESFVTADINETDQETRAKMTLAGYRALRSQNLDYSTPQLTVEALAWEVYNAMVAAK